MDNNNKVTNTNNTPSLSDDGYFEEARLILQDKIKQHQDKNCECKFLPDGNTSLLCTAGLWLEKVVPSKNVVQDYFLELNRTKTKLNTE